MALGYETTGTAPSIIANAGNAMAADIRRIGETIRKDIQQHNTDKQVFGFLNEAKALDPSAPTFQNDLVGVFAKYPAAAADQRALTGAKLLHDQWSQVQLSKKMQTSFENQKALIRERNGGNYGDTPTPAFSGSGGLATEQPTTAPPLGSPQGGFSFGGGVRRHPTGVDPDLPPLPQGGGAEGGVDPNAGLGALDQTLRKIPNLPAKAGAGVMARAAGQQFANQQKVKSPTAKMIPGVGLAEYNPETKTWDVAIESKRPEKWLNMGSHWENAETGVQKPIEMSEKQAADVEARTEARVDKTAARDEARVTKLVTTQIANRKRDLGSLEKAISERQKVKEPTAEQSAEMTDWQTQHAALRAEIAGLEAELGGASDVIAVKTAAEALKLAPGTRYRTPDGRTFTR